jgi:hypothetical protein
MKTIKLPRLCRLQFFTIFVVPVVCSFVFCQEVIQRKYDDG